MNAAVHFKLSAFADEISPDLKVQIKTLVALGISGLDLRSVDNVNVLGLTDDDLKRVADQTVAAGLVVQAIGSPVNKVPYSVAAQPEELEKLKKSIHAANLTGTRRIRLFTPEAADTDASKVIEWMREQIQLAADHDVVLLHENDGRFWGAFPANAKRLFTELGGPNFKAAFDFANTVLIGFRPMPDWFPWLLPHLDTIHIKDAVEAQGKVVPAGEGNGDLGKTLAWLIQAGWNGPLTLEPHLSAAGPLGGFSGEQLFGVATHALRSVLSDIGASA